MLPSLEQSERINRGAITIAFPLADVRALDRHDSQPGGTRAPRPELSPEHALRWTDPKVVSALLMWLVFAVLLHARFSSGDAWPKRDGPDDRGLCVPGFHLDRRRRAPAAHGPRRDRDFDRPGGSKTP